MNPFDKITFKITRNEIEYTYGGTIVATYTDGSEPMCLVSIMGGEVLHVKQSKCTKIN